MKKFHILAFLTIISIKCFSQSGLPYEGGSGFIDAPYLFGGELGGTTGWCVANLTSTDLTWSVGPNNSIESRSTTLTWYALDADGSYVLQFLMISQYGMGALDTIPQSSPPISNPCQGFAVTGPVNPTPGLTEYNFTCSYLAGKSYAWTITGNSPLPTIISGQGTNVLVVSLNPNTYNGATVSVVAGGCSGSFSTIPL